MNSSNVRLHFVALIYLITGMMLLFFYPTNLLWPILAVTAGGLYFRLEWARKLGLFVAGLSAFTVMLCFFPLGYGFEPHALLQSHPAWLRAIVLLLVETFVLCLGVLLWHKPKT